MTGIWWILTRVLEVSKICVFIGSYCAKWKYQNWDFDEILLSKLENVWAQNLQRSYVSWQWRMIEKLKRNWLLDLKLTCEISRILTRALGNLKTLCFNGLLVTKVYNVWAKTVQRSYLSWHWKVMQNLKKNWLVLGRAVNFNMTKISIKTVRVSRPFVSCDYEITKQIVYSVSQLLNRLFV